MASKNVPVYGDAAQIDIVIDRADQIVNLCKMKFSTPEYAIEKIDEERLRHKTGRFRETQKRHTEYELLRSV